MDTNVVEEIVKEKRTNKLYNIFNDSDLEKPPNSPYVCTPKQIDATEMNKRALSPEESTYVGTTSKLSRACDGTPKNTKGMITDSSSFRTRLYTVVENETPRNNNTQQQRLMKKIRRRCASASEQTPTIGKGKQQLISVLFRQELHKKEEGNTGNQVDDVKSDEM